MEINQIKRKPTDLYYKDTSLLRFWQTRGDYACLCTVLTACSDGLAT